MSIWKKAKRPMVVLLAVLMAVSSLSACNGGGSGSSSTSAQQKTNVNNSYLYSGTFTLNTCGSNMAKIGYNTVTFSKAKVTGQWSANAPKGLMIWESTTGKWYTVDFSGSKVTCSTPSVVVGTVFKITGAKASLKKKSYTVDMDVTVTSINGDTDYARILYEYK